MRIVTLIALFGLIVVSCKKEDEDPLMPLKTRKARLVGEWKLSNYLSESVSDYITVNSTFENSVEIVETTYPGALDTVIRTTTYVTNQIKFQKDGS